MTSGCCRPRTSERILNIGGHNPTLATRFTDRRRQTLRAPMPPLLDQRRLSGAALWVTVGWLLVAQTVRGAGILIPSPGPGQRRVIVLGQSESWRDSSGNRSHAQMAKVVLPRLRRQPCQ